MILNPNVAVVAPLELITSAHHNAVRSNVLRGAALDETQCFTGETFFSAAGFAGGNPGDTTKGVWISRSTGTVYVMNQEATTTTPALALSIGGAADVTGKQFAQFRRYTSAIGSISAVAGGSSVAYNTSSDERLKNVVGDVDPNDALDQVRRLHIVRYNWKTDADANEFVGLIAQDVADVVPEAVTGEPDAVDADGNVEPMQLDRSALVPFLIAAVQALTARVEQLEGAAPQ